MIFAAQALLDYVPDPTEAQVRAALHGNLCRCTGYQNIVDAVLLAAQRRHAVDKKGETA
jgi:carbon-monoxide dehydrogenase small subunit